MAGFNVALGPQGLEFIDHEPDPIDAACRLPDIDALLELINDGSYDDHIEAILAAGHARKRERRGVRRPYGVPR